MKLKSEFNRELVGYAFKLVEKQKESAVVVEKILEKVGKEYHLSGVYIKEARRESRCLRYLYIWGAPSIEEYPGRKYYLGEKNWKSIENYFEKQKYMISTQEKKKNLSDTMCRFMDRNHVKSMLQFPLFRQGELIGCIDLVDTAKKREWKKGEIDTLKTLATIITAYLFKLRAYEEAAEQVRILSECDSKTGLFRYEYFLQKTGTAIQSNRFVEKANEGNAYLQQYGQSIMIYTDFSNFRYLNDNFGYEVGNEVLHEFGRHIQQWKADQLIGCRIYSDHFIIYMELTQPLSKEELAKCIKCRNQMFVRSVKRKFPEINLLIYSGIYFIDVAKDSVEDAISNANLARKNARKISDSNCMIFEEEMRQCLIAQAEYTSRLRTALNQGELLVYYQPKYSCGRLEMIGAEALIRWQKKDGTMIRPDEFIPYLENNGSIVLLDYFVYENVCMTLSERIKAGKKVVPISVNVSRVHAKEKNIVLFVEYLLRKYQIPPELLEFEITESLYMEDINAAKSMVKDMKALGVSISMDDFGTGYSSLNVLKHLPIDILKIDRSFIQMEGEQKVEDVIVRNVIRMAKELGLDVICEGVERVEQMQFLEEAGCDSMQGFYFSKPVCEPEFMKMLSV